MDQQLEPPTTPENANDTDDASVQIIPPTPENANDTDDASVQIIPLDYDDANERTKYQWHNLYGHARQRAFITRGAMAVAMVLLLLIILANNMLSIGTIPRSALKRLFPVPSPTLPPIRGSNLYYLEVNVPQERVTIDGHLLLQVPRPGVDPPLALSPGSHVITWTAYPFRQQSCTISAPYSFGDNCDYAPYELSVLHNDQAAVLLLLGESLSELPVSLQQSLVTTVQATIDHIRDSVPVRPGERYLAESSTPARQPLIATLHFNFEMKSMMTNDLVIDSKRCQQLCVVPWRFPDSTPVPLPQTPGTWLSVALVQPTWDYATQDGRVIARNQPIDQGEAGVGAHPILLRITRMNSGWQVTPLIGALQAPPLNIYSGSSTIVRVPADVVSLTDNPACVAAQDFFQGDSSAVRYISGPHIAGGCLVAEPVLTHAPLAYFLEHFGVLLAVNSAAHTDFPWLPLVDTYEYGLAMQLLTPSGQSSQFSTN